MERRNRQISLPTDTTANILRHLSRKKLSQDLYLVNRNIWQIATSSHLVPNVHSIKYLYINTRDKLRYYNVDNIRAHVSDFDPEINSGYGNLIGIHNNSKYYEFPVSYFVQKIPIPEPFVRFGKYVHIQHCEDEALIRFLREAKESFLGCAMTIHFHSDIASDDEQNKLAYLFENAFIEPAEINQESRSALLNWLQNDYREDNKKAFEDENSPPTAFLITFFGSDAGACGPCLEGDHSFYLTKTSTNEKLSFIKQNRNNYLYRLWRRKVISDISDFETEDQYKRTTIYQSR
ncbi:hypothetical protein DdX_12976 [Ditylenchus destructor]|uniref:F-box domain-containing protein n=1 Tax=Ditylenchus destructor TaxID=166010 RepID=A0AAD4MZQ1_9BILA|nr:hypothetical protein DdX_12976 [Ditylenchus destructor]